MQCFIRKQSGGTTGSHWKYQRVMEQKHSFLATRRTGTVWWHSVQPLRTTMDNRKHWTFCKGFHEEELLLARHKCHQFLRPNNLRTPGLSLYGQNGTVAAPRTNAIHSCPRPKGKFLTSILKEKPSRLLLFRAGARNVSCTQATLVTSKENEITRIASGPAFPEAPMHEKKFNRTSCKLWSMALIKSHQWDCLQTKNAFHIF